MKFSRVELVLIYSFLKISSICVYYFPTLYFNKRFLLSMLYSINHRLLRLVAATSEAINMLHN